MNRKMDYRNSIAIFILTFCFIFSALSLNAQEIQKVGTSAAAFLKIPVGARGSSMGGAIVASVDDPSSLYWNPGGLSRNEKYGFMVDYTPWLPGLSFNFIGLVLPVEELGTIGVSVSALTTEEMDVTTPSNPNGTGEKFDASSVVVAVAYGRNLTDRFSIGGSIKYINERIFNSSASGYAIDIGTIYDTPLEGLRLGFSVSNFGSKLRIDGEDLNVRIDIAPDQLGNNQSVVGRLKTENFDLPLIMRLGFNYEALRTEQMRFTVALDGINPSDNGQSVNVGGELSFLNDMFLLRGGYSELFLEDNEKGLTFGIGLNMNIAQGIDLNTGYSFEDFKHLPNVNRFSMVLMF